MMLAGTSQTVHRPILDSSSFCLFVSLMSQYELTESRLEWDFISGITWKFSTQEPDEPLKPMINPISLNNNGTYQYRWE